MRLGDLDLLESRRAQLALELLARERARDAAGPLLHVAAGCLVHVRVGDNVADREAPTGTQHPSGLAEDRRLVGRKVDHAVGDDHVDRVVGKGYGLDGAPQELDILDPGLALMPLGELEHLVGHVEPVCLPARAPPTGREQDVDAPAGTEIENGLALVELCHRGGIAATERGELGRIGQRLTILDAVNRRAEAGVAAGIRDIRAASARRLRRPTAPRLSLSYRSGCSGVALADDVADLI